MEKIGIYFQSGLIVLGITVVPVMLVNWYAEKLLLVLHQDPEIAALAGEFSRLTMIGVPFLFVYELFKKLLQSQNIVHPMAFIAFLGVLVNIIAGYATINLLQLSHFQCIKFNLLFICRYYLTYHTNLGYLGAAYARVLGNMILPISLIPYFWYSPVYKQWWRGFQWKEAINHASLFLHLGLPGTLMIVIEWWAFSLLAMFAGLLPNSVEAISVNTVLANSLTTIYMVFLGISVAANVRIGNCLGANKPKHAKLISRISLLAVLISSLGTGLFVYVNRYEIPMLFLNDSATVE